MNIESKFHGVLQGPMGSELRKLGIEERSEDSYVAHQRVHEAYRVAGATVFVANTFGATPLRRHTAEKLSLQCQPDGKRFGPVYTQMNRTMTEIARSVAGPEALVAGSVAPIVDTSGKHDRSWRRFNRKGRLGFLNDRQAPQINALINAEVDMILGEAFRYPEEARAIAELAQEFGARALAISFEATMRGVPYQGIGDPKTFRDLKKELQVLAPEVEIFVGANCTGLSVLQAILEKDDELDLAYANSLDLNGHQRDYSAYATMKVAGRSEDQTAIETIEDRYQTPDINFGQFATFAFNRGVKVVGGCCGTTPDTTRVIRNSWDDFLAGQESGSMATAP